MGSIFEQIKKMEYYDYSSGDEEIRCLYLHEELSIKEQIALCDKVIEQLINMSKKNIIEDIKLKNIALIYYMEPLINKIKLLVKEKEIDEIWIKRYTEELLYKSNNPLCVKLGLILGGRYLSDEKLCEIINIYSKTSEYIFYLRNIYRRLEECNSCLFELGKKADGNIKLFAFSNIEFMDLEMIRYMVKEGYNDDKCGDILIKYIMNNMDLEGYLDHYINKNDLDDLAALVYRYLEENNLTDDNYNFIKKYIKLVNNRGKSIKCLYSVILIKEALLDSNIKEKTKLQKEVDNILLKETWANIYENAVINGEEESYAIVDIADYYNIKLNFKNLKPYLERDYKDINVLTYLLQEGEEEDKLKVLKFFNNNFDIDSLTNNIHDIETIDFIEENADYILFSIIISSCRHFYPEGKNIALKGIFGNMNEIRNESIRTLRRYKSKLTESEINLIEEAYKKEVNKKLKLSYEKLLYEEDKGKIEFIDVSNLKIEEHIEDVYLITTAISGVQFRQKEYLDAEIEDSNIFYLQREEDNPYDDRAIKVAGEKGYVLGYISRENNLILNNLLLGHKYLYGKLEEYNLDNNHITMKIYQSYRDVIEAINNTLKMISSSKNGGYIN
ncbi:MAG: hypothetical protein E7214_01365 [Clostridium sp.]|nr:hypothetical protein [Clostridium sp.]